MHRASEIAQRLLLEKPAAAQVLLKRALARTDPLCASLAELTKPQLEWLHATHREKIAEGGNQSGKTWTAGIDFWLEALGKHPTIKWEPHFPGAPWRGWWATCSYDMFASQAWEHWKRLLLYPWESVLRLPTRRILEIGWDTKNPERPLFLKARRDDGAVAEIAIKSYESGAGAFQSAGVDRVHLDEECPTKIYEECQMRGATKKGRITVSATPVVGVDWLANLRADAESGESDVFHRRFDTRDNPKADPKFIAGVVKRFRHQPKLIDLRLGGFPLAMEGVVYNDLIFTPEHVIEPFAIPTNWTRYRVIDPGWRHCACTWWAVSPREDDLILYRDYIGSEQTVANNCRAMIALTSHEPIARTWIDRHYCQKHEEAHGEKIIELYKKCGVPCVESVDIGIVPGIYDTWELLGQRSGPNGSRPRFRVFKTCNHFLDERRRYKWPEARERGNEGVENPVDRDNHVLKCFVYFWAARPKWQPPRAPKPAAGSVAELLMRDRMQALQPRGGRL